MNKILKNLFSQSYYHLDRQNIILFEERSFSINNCIIKLFYDIGVKSVHFYFLYLFTICDTVTLSLALSGPHLDLRPSSPGELDLRRFGFDFLHTFAQQFMNTIAQLL